MSGEIDVAALIAPTIPVMEANGYTVTEGKKIVRIAGQHAN